MRFVIPLVLLALYGATLGTQTSIAMGEETSQVVPYLQKLTAGRSVRVESPRLPPPPDLSHAKEEGVLYLAVRHEALFEELGIKFQRRTMGERGIEYYIEGGGHGSVFSVMTIGLTVHTSSMLAKHYFDYECMLAPIAPSEVGRDIGEFYAIWGETRIVILMRNIVLSIFWSGSAKEGKAFAREVVQIINENPNVAPSGMFSPIPRVLSQELVAERDPSVQEWSLRPVIQGLGHHSGLMIAVTTDSRHRGSRLDPDGRLVVSGTPADSVDLHVANQENVFTSIKLSVEY